MQIWLMTKQIFKFVIFLFFQCQTIDNFCRYITVHSRIIHHVRRPNTHPLIVDAFYFENWWNEVNTGWIRCIHSLWMSGVACFPVHNWRILYIQMKAQCIRYTATDFHVDRFSSVFENQLQSWSTDFGFLPSSSPLSETAEASRVILQLRHTCVSHSATVSYTHLTLPTSDLV